ncbi:MAG: diaminopimelate epimerase, partial [Clostridia bacterium]|nr:diaminopimelate epimerase [Clostridia bacterium]
RSVAKYLFDNGYVFSEDMTVETAAGVKSMHLFTRDGRVNYVEVNMGPADLSAASLPTTLDDDCILNKAIFIGDEAYCITCCSIGNPHCVVFCDRVDPIDLKVIGPQFENNPIFPDRINTEFVRVVNDATLKVRVYERGNGETMACGTGACAAVVAACENGYCRKGEDITVKLPGGDLLVNYTDERVTLSGDTALVFKGMYQY